MEEFSFQQIIDNAIENDFARRDYSSRNLKGAPRWYYDETDYDSSLDLTTIFRDEE